jgi:predicted lipoprotein with Yx(FWY)xxD motif
MNKFRTVALVVLGVVAAGVLAVAAVGSTKTSSVALHTTALGKVLAGSNGRTLYAFTADKGKSACYGKCAAVWPPLLAGSNPSVGAGLNSSMLGTTKRTDGKLQVTYNGHPLYYFAKDTKAGDANGQSIDHFGGQWWVVSAAGSEITTKG